MDPNTPVGGTTLAKIEKASVKRILKDLVSTQPELLREAIIAGLLAPPPRSFPYIALAAAYLDGKPVDQDKQPSASVVDLSELSREQLRERAERLVRALKSADSEQESVVIDAEVIPQDLDKLSPEALQAEIARAQEDVRRAEAEVERANEMLRASRLVNR